MATHKNIEKVCIIITVIAVIVTALFMNGSRLGITASDAVTMNYENSLFDDSYVHSIDIEIDDWDSFLETATSEEYTAVNVTIDGEKIKNVALRAKGNTSLSTVSQLGSERYSLKIEFDRYQESTNYHGLDKLCLNNLIQDYTMMKDYIAYKLMNEFGVAAPLVSFVYVTVNGEDWGLFLAVEAVEESFLERNYGTNYGDLYKPDTMSMGGGRGNGGGFDMRDMDFDQMGIPNPFENSGDESDEDSDDESESNPFGNMDFSNMQPPSDGEMPSGFGGGFPVGGEMPGGFDGFGFGNDDAKIKYIDDDTDSYSTVFNSAKTTVNTADKKRLISAIKSLNEGIANSDDEAIEEALDIDEVLRYMVVHNFVVNGDSYTGSMIHNYYLYEEDGKMSMIPWDYNLAYGTFQGSDSNGTVNDPIDNPLNITDGDTDRPMFSWIISSEKYTQMYHEYYEEFLEQFYTSGYLTDLIDNVYEMIYPYVEKDPTKFCEMSDFEKAVQTIREFVVLRCQSIEGQLNGSIGSTDAEQSANPDALIDASSITISDMGSMGGEGGGFGPGSDNGDDKGFGPGSGFESGDDKSSDSDSGNSKEHSSDHRGGKGERPGRGEGKSRSENKSSSDAESQSSEESSEETDSLPENFSGDFLGGFGGGNMPGEFGGGNMSGDSDNGGMPSDFPSDFNGFGGSTVSATNYIYFGACVATLLAAIIFALKYRNRR